MTIDIEAVDVDPDNPDEAGPSGPPDPEVDDDELLVLASSRMSTYYALHGLPRAALAVRPVGAGISDRRRYLEGAADLVTPLEDDEPTLEVRTLAQDPESYARILASSRLDLLTARVPGTDLGSRHVPSIVRRMSPA